MEVQSKELFDWLAILLPLGGIALSWWSFRFAEDGATPDAWTGLGASFDVEKEDVEKGMRYRARRCAHMLFAGGALFLAAAVPMGAAAARSPDQATLPALGGFAIIAIGFVYIVVETSNIWRARREDAFGIYFNKDMYFLYDEAKTKAMYFALNPMPIWSILNRHWLAGRRLPAIDDVFAKASKASASTSSIEPR